MNVGVPTPDGDATSFLVFLQKLAIGEVSLAQSREVGGWIDMHAANRRVFVASGDAPTITRYAVSDHGTLSDEKEISFQAYGASSAGYGLNSYATSSRAYFTSDALERVIWDPSTMKIIGTLSINGVPDAPTGMSHNASYDRGVLVRDGNVFHSLYTANWDDMTFGPSRIAVWNAETDKVVNVLESECPMLDAATKDDEGNVYYTPWSHAVASQLTTKGARTTCAVRIPADEVTLDEAWSGDLSSLVGGRPVINLQYAGNGTFFGGVLHTERLVDPIDVDQVFAANWRLWRFDLAAKTASVVEELGWNDGGYALVRLEGRTYLILSTETDGSTGYAVEEDGTIRKIFHSSGFVSQIAKI